MDGEMERAPIDFFVTIPGRNARDQFVQSIASLASLRLGHLGDELALVHAHLGGLAVAGADLLFDRLGHAQRQRVADLSPSRPV